MLSSFRDALEVWQGELRKAVTAYSTHRGLWFVQPSTQGRGLHSVFLPRCLGTSLAFTLVLSECPCHAQGGVVCVCVRACVCACVCVWWWWCVCVCVCVCGEGGGENNWCISDILSQVLTCRIPDKNLNIWGKCAAVRLQHSSVMTELHILCCI